MKFVLLSTILLGASLMAETPSSTRGPLSFDAYDQNRNGSISEVEFNEVKAAHMSANAEAKRPMRNVGNSPDFSFFDTNKDGKISKDEFAKAQQILQKKRRN